MGVDCHINVAGVYSFYLDKDIMLIIPLYLLTDYSESKDRANCYRLIFEIVCCPFSEQQICKE